MQAYAPIIRRQSWQATCNGFESARRKTTKPRRKRCPLRAAPNSGTCLVLAALGLKQLNRGAPTLGSPGMRDMLLAWSTARRAH